MRKLRWIALAGLAALAAAGVAVAVIPKGISLASASWTASPTDQVRTRTCTGADGTYQIVRGVFTGTATGDLAGNVRLRLHKTLNTTENRGFVKGKLVVRSGDETKAHANLVGVLNGSNGTTVNGFLTGRIRDGGALLANFSGTLNGSSFSGQLGGGSAANSAIVFGGTGCVREGANQAALQGEDEGNGRGRGKGKRRGPRRP